MTLRLFTQTVTLPIGAMTIAKATRFAERVVGTIGTPGIGYSDANQTDLEKIKHDHYVSKLGEEAVAAVFRKLGRKVRGPDYEIYHGKQKSWDADLAIDDIDLAVKTQSLFASVRFGLSWTFAAGASRKDPILNQPEAWVCFAVFDEVQQVCVVYPPYQIQELEFGEPKLARLKDSKKVVYVESLF